MILLYSSLFFFFIGYLATVVLEAIILIPFLSSRHSLKIKLVSCALLTAFTYPFVVFFFPKLILDTFGELFYVLIAETFAPFAECVLFCIIIKKSYKKLCCLSTIRDFAAIIFANIFSFLIGEFFWFQLKEYFENIH